MAKINYIKGDATNPIGTGNKIITHICNDIGGWGKGFVTAISKKWKEPEASYRDWYKSGEKFALGEVQFVKVQENLWIANLIGQRDIKTKTKGEPPIRYDAVKQGLDLISKFALENNCSVHMPRIGCGLAGGKWGKIEPIILDELISKNIETTVYDFE
ncbi:MAG: macro domain-containing protein [Cytophagaceae bacterium]